MEQRGTQPAGLGKLRYVLLAGIFALVVLLTASGLLLANFRDEENPPQGLDRVQVLDPPREVAGITLMSGDGEPLALSDLRGAPVLLFFGYTHCPDVCPTTLAEFRQVKQMLGDDGDRVGFVFISVDGSRDTPEVVGSYVSQFDPEFIGLTGPEADVRSLGEPFNLYFVHGEPSGSSAGYLVDHTAYSYLIDPDGRLRIIYPYDTSVERIVSDLRAYLT